MNAEQFNDEMKRRRFERCCMWWESGWASSDISLGDHERDKLLKYFGGDYTKLLDYVDRWIADGHRPPTNAPPEPVNIPEFKTFVWPRGKDGKPMEFRKIIPDDMESAQPAAEPPPAAAKPTAPWTRFI